jgi:hypothetical protein
MWRRMKAVAAGAAMALIAGLFALNILGSFAAPWIVKRAKLPNEVRVERAELIGPSIVCFSYRDWLVTTISGPCGQFSPPPQIALGKRFQEGGTERQIGIIIATQVQRDLPGAFPLVAGDWYCEAAADETDLDHEGKQWHRVWLLVPRCKPTGR